MHVVVVPVHHCRHFERHCFHRHQQQHSHHQSQLLSGSAVNDFALQTRRYYYPRRPQLLLHWVRTCFVEVQTPIQCVTSTANNGQSTTRKVETTSDQPLENPSIERAASGVLLGLENVVERHQNGSRGDWLRCRSLSWFSVARYSVNNVNAFSHPRRCALHTQQRTNLQQQQTQKRTLCQKCQAHN